MATSKLMTSMKKHGLLTLLGILVLAIAMKQFSNRKGNSYEALSHSQPKWNDSRFNDEDAGSPPPQQAHAAPRAPAAANPVGQNSKFAAINGANASTQGLPPSCTRQPVANPAELLPLGNNAWGNLNPEGGGNMSGVNLLKAGYHSGVNTVGNSLRNANLQVRSEPPNPQSRVGPWNNTTIEPDLMRVPLEIGCGPQ